MGFDHTNEIFFYPNPAIDELKFFARIEKIRIYNSTGRLVLAQSLQKGTQVLDTKKLQPGLLFIQTEANGQLITAKILKK